MYKQEKREKRKKESHKKKMYFRVVVLSLIFVKNMKTAVIKSRKRRELEEQQRQFLQSRKIQNEKKQSSIRKSHLTETEPLNISPDHKGRLSTLNQQLEIASPQLHKTPELHKQRISDPNKTEPHKRKTEVGGVTVEPVSPFVPLGKMDEKHRRQTALLPVRQRSRQGRQIYS